MGQIGLISNPNLFHFTENLGKKKQFGIEKYFLILKTIDLRVGRTVLFPDTIGTVAFGLTDGSTTVSALTKTMRAKKAINNFIFAKF